MKNEFDSVDMKINTIEYLREYKCGMIIPPERKSFVNIYNDAKPLLCTGYYVEAKPNFSSNMNIPREEGLLVPSMVMGI